MALITFSGYPSSGKTTRAIQLQQFLTLKLSQPSTHPQLKRLKIVLINDESLVISKSAYDDSKAEKPARATLLSGVIRFLNLDTIVIVDAMNYIKGSRYQMYLSARETSVRVCTVHIATPPDKCKEWNRTREPSLAYSEPTIENLITRYEEPSSAARWDSPLIIIPWMDDDLSQVVPVVIEAGSENVEGDIKGGVDAEAIWDAITKAGIKPANAATIATPTSSTSYLTMLESTTTLLITTLLSLQSLSPSPISSDFLLPTLPTPTPVSISLSKVVTMAMLQRLKRSYIKLNQQASGLEFNVSTVARLFADYLELAVR